MEMTERKERMREIGLQFIEGQFKATKLWTINSILMAF